MIRKIRALNKSAGRLLRAATQHMSILLRNIIQVPACSNLAQEFSVQSTVICRKEAWTPGLDHVYREVFCRFGSRLGPGFITMKPKISRFVTNKGNRQEKLHSQNLDDAFLKRRYSVYIFFETTTQGSELKVL